eukprot:2278539-Prymnesium_polylepis.2
MQLVELLHNLECVVLPKPVEASNTACPGLRAAGGRDDLVAPDQHVAFEHAAAGVDVEGSRDRVPGSIAHGARGRGIQLSERERVVGHDMRPGEADLRRALGCQRVAPVELPFLQALLAPDLSAAVHGAPTVKRADARLRLPPGLAFPMPPPAASLVDNHAASTRTLRALALVGAYVGLVHGEEPVEALWRPDDDLVIRLLRVEERVADGHAILDSEVGPHLVPRLFILRAERRGGGA